MSRIRPCEVSPCPARSTSASNCAVSRSIKATVKASRAEEIEPRREEGRRNARQQHSRRGNDQRGDQRVSIHGNLVETRNTRGRQHRERFHAGDSEDSAEQSADDRENRTLGKQLRNETTPTR